MMMHRPAHWLRPPSCALLALLLAGCASAPLPPAATPAQLPAPAAALAAPPASLAAGAAPAAAGAPALQPTSQLLEIQGALAAVAAPPGATAVVELRDVARPDGAVVAESRLPLAGPGQPTPFVLQVPRSQLQAGGSYAVQGAVMQGARGSWITRPVPLDVHQPGPLALGTLALEPFQPLAFASAMRCGRLPLKLGFLDQHMLLVLPGGKLLELAEVASESSDADSSRFVALDDPATWVDLQGERMVLTLRGRRLPDCVPAAERLPAAPGRSRASPQTGPVGAP